MVTTITTHENHQRFAEIINQFIWARQQRLKGNVQKALEQEALDTRLSAEGDWW